MKYKLLFILILLQAVSASSQDKSNSLVLIAESDKSTLSQVVDLDVNFTDEIHQIFIADVFTSSVLVGKRKGNEIALDKRLGRDGLGPGEFIEVTNVHLYSEDRLLVYDNNLARISLFNIGSQKLEQSIKLDTRRSTHFPMEVIALIDENGGTKLFYTRSEMFYSDNYID